MFYGEYRHTIDAKGRIIIPAKFRKALKKIDSNRLIVTRGIEKCLFIFSLSEWKTQEERFRSLPLNKSNPRAFSRILFSGAYRCLPDKQGRINLPQNLIEYAKIKKEIVIIGVSNRIEIWNLGHWKDYFHKSERSFVEIAEELVEGRNSEAIESRRSKDSSPR